jgi:hypothetical protein
MVLLPGKVIDSPARPLLPQKTSAGSPAQKNHPSEENLMRMNLVKYFTLKVENKLKRVPGRAANYY